MAPSAPSPRTRADRRTFSTIALYKEDRPGKLFQNYSIFPFTYHAWNYGGQNITADWSTTLAASASGTFELRVKIN